MGEVPEELVFEILLRLPVKSLLRFRCVSESLCAVMDTPDFINSRLIKSCQNMNLHKLIFSDQEWEKYLVYDANVDLDRESIYLGKPVSSSWKTLIGYCKGLLVLHTSYPFGFTMWNPSTRKHWDLPDFPLFVFQSNYVRDYTIDGSGLGYDQSIDEYKVVCIVSKHMWNFPRRKVLIYGLKSNIWSSQNLPYVNCYLNRTGDLQGIGVFTDDGSLHWLCEHTTDNVIWQSDIMSFDVKKETFSLFPQPVCSMKRVSNTLHVLEGCLCINYYGIDMQPKAELYMRIIRKKDGVDEFHWIQLYSVILEPSLPYNIRNCMFETDIMKVLSYSKRRDKILLYLSRDGMVWYDIINKNIVYVEINNHGDWPKCPLICIESLMCH